MNKWDNRKLDEMTQQENEYVNIRLNYTYIAENYENIYIKTYTKGDIIPTMFEDVHLAYDGLPADDINLPQIDEKTKEEIDDKKRQRKVIEIKHFSRSMSHKAWFEHLEKEVNEFIKKYPEYGECLI